MKTVLSNNKVSDYMQGLEHLKRNDFAAAKDSFQKAINQNERSSFAHHYLGEAHFFSAEFDDAEKCFHRAFELNQHFAPTLLYLGKIAETKNDALKKDELFQSALQQSGRTSGELKQLARTLVKLEGSGHPVVPDLYLEAHRSNPQDFEIYLDIAGIVPPNAELFARFGEQLAAMDKLEQAIFFLYLTAHLRPHDGENWMKLADALSVSGDTKSAEICRSRANATY